MGESYDSRLKEINKRYEGLTKDLEKDKLKAIFGLKTAIKFINYKEHTMTRKNNKLNAVILLSHIGIECGDKNNLTLNMFKPSDELGECNKDSDLYNLLFELDKGTIDAVVTGHSHWENHIFVNDIPIISPINNGLYSNILYLAFNRKNG